VTDTAGNTETTGAATKSILGIAAVACVACCIGPILGVLGAIAALGLLSTILIGVAGLLVSAAAVAVLVIVRRRVSTPRAHRRRTRYPSSSPGSALAESRRVVLALRSGRARRVATNNGGRLCDYHSDVVLRQL
jgi:hypothetical protein